MPYHKLFYDSATTCYIKPYSESFELAEFTKNNMKQMC